MTTTEVTVGGVQATTETMPSPAKPKRARAKRKTFNQVRAAEQAKYDALMQELADEVNALKEQLDAERATLCAIRGSWITALRYCFKGEV